jgi:glycosyltransferase involved in cell wall biosynthesis
VGGIPEIVEDGRNGLLVPSLDARALESALGRLVDDPALLRALASRARPSVEERFSIERMTRATEDVLDRVLAGAAR